VSSLLIKNGRVIDKSQNLDAVCDVLAIDGVITKIEPNIEFEAQTIIDATNLVVCAGLIDMHVHLREPGFEYKEDIKSGCEAALAGGFTGVACMPNTKPVIDNVETINYIQSKAKETKVKVFIIASVTKGLKGEELSDFEMLKNAGAIGVSDDGRPVENLEKMKEAMELALKNEMVIISHCEDLEIIENGIINKGAVSQKLGVEGMDRISEDSITKREIEIAKQTNTKIHIAHVSTKGSTELIREAKKQGVKVTAETCPHYFSLDESLLLKRDADYRMNPPLREKEDVNAIIEGIKDGVFDAIVTDHAPHSFDEKAVFEKAPNGIVGLETSLAAGITFLVEENQIDLGQLLMMMSSNPAEVLGIDGGKLKIGATCDIAIIDTKKEWEVVPQKFLSKSKNTAFKGMKLKGKAIYTIANGEIAYQYKGD
jgi:dihydroorotase